MCVPVYLFPAPPDQCHLRASHDAQDVRDTTGNIEHQRINISARSGSTDHELMEQSFVTISRTRYDNGEVLKCHGDQSFDIALQMPPRRTHILREVPRHAIRHHSQRIAIGDAVEVCRNAPTMSASLVRAIVHRPPPAAAEYACTLVELHDCTTEAPFSVENRSPCHRVLVTPRASPACIDDRHAAAR